MSAIIPLIRSGVCCASIVIFLEIPATVRISPHMLSKRGLLMFVFTGSIKIHEATQINVIPETL